MQHHQCQRRLNYHRHCRTLKRLGLPWYLCTFARSRLDASVSVRVTKPGVKRCWGLYYNQIPMNCLLCNYDILATTLCRGAGLWDHGWRTWLNDRRTTCRLCNNEEESCDQLWLRRPAFDADNQRLDLGASLDQLFRLPARAHALLRIILRCLGWRRRQQDDKN